MRPPRFTERRFRLLETKLREGHQDSARWILSLLRECALRNIRWGDALRRGGNAGSPSARKALSLVDPSVPAFRIINKLSTALLNPGKVSSLEVAAFQVLADRGLRLPERIALDSLKSHGFVGLRCIESWLYRYGTGARLEVSPEYVDQWIDALRSAVDGLSLDDGLMCSNLLARLAATWSETCRSHILRRANDPRDPAQQFVLGALLPRMKGVSTDELTDAAARLLLEVYLGSSSDDRFPSPGAIAHEAFVTELVLPKFESPELTDTVRKGLLETIDEAERRLDRRFLAQVKASSILA